MFNSINIEKCELERICNIFVHKAYRHENVQDAVQEVIKFLTYKDAIVANEFQLFVMEIIVELQKPEIDINEAINKCITKYKELEEVKKAYNPTPK